MAAIVSGVSCFDQAIGGNAWQVKSVATKAVILAQLLRTISASIAPTPRNT
ncbi:MAG: hypothetical protein ABJM29_07490 [Rhizobiaceae bacterium]